MKPSGLIAALLAGIFWCFAASEAAPPDAIRVALIVPGSGPGAMAGLDAIDGFQLGVRQSGGRFGNIDVRLTILDDRRNPQIAAQLARQLARMERSQRPRFILGGTTPELTAAIAGPLVEARSFVFSLSGLPDALSGAGCSPYVFGLGIATAALPEALGNLLSAEGASRVWISEPKNEFGAKATEAFKRRFKGTIAGTSAAKQGNMSYGAEIQRIAAAKPDAVVTFHTGGMGVSFVRQYGAVAGRPPLFGLQQSFEPVALPAMGESAAAARSVGIWAELIDTPQNKRFVSEFEAENGRIPSAQAMIGYEAALLLDAAIRAVHGEVDNHDALRAALRKADFQPIRGPLRFASNQTIVQSIYLRQIGKDARGRSLNEVRSIAFKDYVDPMAGQCPMRW